MPLYEYKCLSCGKKFEALQKFSDDPITVHAECGGPVEKLFSAPAFHLKGTGWYATDYAKTSGASLPKTDDSKASSDSTTSESKPDDKPAAAPAPVAAPESKPAPAPSAESKS
jgi:putative FmdB family regulatory protein